MAQKAKHLYYFDELGDFKLENEGPDVRGWNVKDKAHRIIGKVDNLLINKTNKEVYYFDVAIDPSLIENSKKSSNTSESLNENEGNHLLIPIGLLEIDENEKQLYASQVDYQVFVNAKRIKKGSEINRDYEKVILEAYNPITQKANSVNSGSEKGIENFYKRKEFDRSRPFRFRL